MKEIKIYEIPNIDSIERIDDPYIGMIFYVADIDTYYSVKTLKEINGINMKGSKVVEYVIDEYADFGTGSGGGSGGGLTSTQKQQLKTAYEHSQSPHVTTDDVSMAVRSYVNSNIGLLKGDKGDKGDVGADAINPSFTIGVVTTLPSGSDATVTLTGTYPNLVLNFGIPRGADGSGGGAEEPVDTTPYMYYGRLSLQDVGGTMIQYNQITEAMIKKGVTDGKLTKEAPKTMSKTSMGEAAETAEGDYIVILVPTAKNYTVTKDNGFGGKMAFDEETAGANGVDITINNVPCKLYGEILLSQGKYFIYID